MLVVSKFGGSSVANSTQFKKVKNIIESNPYRNVVIVSALGKKEKGDSKITDLLYLFLFFQELKQLQHYDKDYFQ